jgi:hypothetical protein
MWRNHLGGDAGRMAVALASRYDELALPIDTAVEVHTRADRSTLALRRILADLVAAAAAEGQAAPGRSGPATPAGAAQGGARRPDPTMTPAGQGSARR